MFQLESWIHSVITGNWERDASFRIYAGRIASGPPTRMRIETYRDFNLCRTLQYAYAKSEFYRNKFNDCGLKPEHIGGYNDLHRFPLTEPSDLSRTPRHFLCTSQSKIARPRIFVTSGTTGPQKEIYWSSWDIEHITDFMAAGIRTVATANDTVQILLPDYGPDSQGDLLRQGVMKMGANPVVTGISKSAAEQLAVLDSARSTIVFGYAGYVYRISKELQASHHLGSKGVRILFLAGEYVPPARRTELENIWGCTVRTHYGLTEMGLGVAVECQAGDGYHFNERDLLVELVDPETGERTPPGEEGELVFTTLTREAMPLIRYRTHDLSRLILEPCACGALSLLKFAAVRKRLESIVSLSNGETIYPSLFGDRLYAIPDVIDYEAKLFHENKRDRLILEVEVASKRENIIHEISCALQNIPAVSQNMASGKMLPPDINLVRMGALNSGNRAKKLIEDTR